MSRRLPVYFLVDVSESMAGRELLSLNEAIASITGALRADPYALETVWVAVLAFAGRAKCLTPLTEIVRFIPPDLPIGGGTNLAAGLDLLMASLKTEVRRGSVEQKGDWRPLVFLLTDGRPTDDAGSAILRWQSDFSQRATMVAVSIGGQADHAILGRLTDNVVIFNDAAPEAFSRFAQWISASVSAQSESAARGQGDVVRLSKSLDDVVRPLEEAASSGQGVQLDERYAVLVGRCSGNGKPYLLKYAPAAAGQRYLLDSSHALEMSYFDLCDTDGQQQSVSTGMLGEGAPCPQCGNEAGVSGCECGNILCTAANGGTYTCPWCGITGQWRPARRAFDIHRGRG